MTKTVEEIERRLRLLREKLDAGAISPDQFENEVKKLHFRDASGRAWMIGAQSGRWYYHDGGQWIQAEPPRAKRPAAPPPSGEIYEATTRINPAVRAQPTGRVQGQAQWRWVACTGLVAATLLVLLVVIGVGGYFFLQPDQVPMTPTKAVVVPLPGLITATPTAVAPVAGEPTPTLALANDPKVLIQEADERMENSQYREAIVRYRRATELDPAQAVVYARWARALRLMYPPQLEEALGKAIIATQLAPNNVEALTELAWQNHALGRTPDAISAAQRAIAIDPTHAPAHAVLAEVFLTSGRAAEGIEEARLAVQYGEHNPAAQLAMARALIFTDQNEAALERIRKAVDLAPGVARHYLELGTHLRRMEQYEEAVEAYETAIALQKDLAPAYDGLGRAYFAGPGDYDEAQEAFEQAIDLAPQDASAHSGIGYVYLVKGRLDDAVESFTKALALDPDMDEARQGLEKAQGAEFLAADKTPEAAAEDGETAELLAPPPRPPDVPENETPTDEGGQATPVAPASAPEAPSLADAQPEEPAPAGGGEEVALTGKIIFPVFHSDQASYDIFWWDVAGGGEPQFLMGEASQPAASWDGTALAFRRWKRDSRGIVAMNLTGMQGANYRRLTAQSFVEDAMPAFSPDGGTIVFSSRRESDRQSRLYVVPSGGGQERALEQNFKPIIGVTPNWLKDGRIIYSGCVAESCGLVAINPDGANPTMITDHWTDSVPAPAPDGTRVAFMSQRDGGWELYVVNVDGSGLARLTSNRSDDGLPAWSPDGGSIAYASTEGGVWGIWVIGADGSNPRQLFPIRGSVDGQVAGEDATKSRGWLEERISWIP